MFKKQTLEVRVFTTSKERIKFILAGLFVITSLTGGLVFFTCTSGVVIVSIFTGVDIYYDFRDVFIFLFLPVAVYFDIFALLLLFSPFTFNLAKLWHKVINIVWGYSLIAIPLSIVISVYILNVYESCGQKGPFSGVHYVKDPKMCEQFEYHPEKDKSDDQ